MKTIFPSSLLKTALLADAVVGGTIALLHLSMPGRFAEWLELPRTLLVGSGVALLGFVALLLLLAFSTRVLAALVWAVVLGNIGWAVGCMALLATTVVLPNAHGIGYLVLHAVSVLLYAGFEWLGLKRSPTASDAPDAPDASSLHSRRR